MVDGVITVVGKIAEYTVAPVLRQFGYLIFYKSNVQDLTEKVTTLTAKREGVRRHVERANRNLEDILPVVHDWLNRVKEIIEEKEECFQEGREEKATACCSSNGWCPNLKYRHSLSRKAATMAPKLDVLLKEDLGTISCPAPVQKIDYPAMQYFEDSTAAPAKPHVGATSSSGTSIPAQPPTPMNLSERLKYRLPYTKDLLTALQDNKMSVIGISGTIREIDTVSTKEFIKRMIHRNLFEEVVMAVASEDQEMKRIQDEISEMLDLKLENGSLVERAERLKARLLASDSKRVLVILADVCGVLDLEAIGISHVNIKRSCKIMLISQLPADVFGELGTQTNFKLLLHSTPTERPVEFESRIAVIRDVMDALTDEESNPIVIYGMGGIGKTTLVMEIGAKANEVQLFDEIAIAEFSQEPDLIKIQGQIAKALGLELTGEEDRAAKLRERLSQGTKNVLLIMDNVWTQLNLWEIGIPISRDKRCCKLLVSSRNQDVFKEMRTRKSFPIGGLPEHDAWRLFKKVAGGSVESDLELLPIAKQVLDECDGLPVAISTVGGALLGKRIFGWRNALRELRNACPENVPGVIKHVYGKIVLSYDCLPSEQTKSCFLLCCLFPERTDLPIEMLVSFGIGLKLFKGIDSLSEGRDCVQELVDTLKSRSLLLEGDEKQSVRMHDVVRDVAMYIASEELAQKKNDELKRRIVLRQRVELNRWRHQNNGIAESTHCCLLTTNMNTELLLLGNIDGVGHVELPATIFNGMEDLKVLLIAHSVLPSVPLLQNLQTLVLVDCNLNFDMIGELRTLMILDLTESGIKRLPDTFKNLSNLRLLNLSGCMELKVILPGVISSLSQLEELYMYDSFQDWVLEKLGSTETTVWISQLEDEDAEPEEVEKWKRLNRLAIEKLASTETTTEEVDDLGDLYAEYINYLEGNYEQHTRWANSMDWRVGLLSELLSLSCLTTLEVVLPPVENLLTSKLSHKLERFKISIGWGAHKFLEASEGNYLRVHGLDASSLAGTEISLLLKKTNTLKLSMKDLTDPLNVMEVNCYAKLESLTLEDCDSLEYAIDMTLVEHIPPSVFPVLSKLTITRGKRLKEIFHGDLPPGSLQKLEILGLWDLPALVTIWTTESQSISLRDLAVLKSIEISKCPSLEAIFCLEGSGHQLKEIIFLNLRKLELKDLPSFTGISKSTHNRKLEISSSYHNSYTIEQSLFSDPKVVFPVLRYLDIEGLVNLKKIWNSQLSPDSFSELRGLTVRRCDNLLHLVPTKMQNRLPALEYIEVYYCSSLEEIFEVRRLTVNEGNASVSQIDKIVLNISQPDQRMPISDIMDFKQSCQGFQNLTSLVVISCGSLRYLLSPSIARGLVKLQSLQVESCNEMEAIVAPNVCADREDEIMLPELSTLTLMDLPNLGSFSQGKYTFDWPLKEIDIKNCNKMNKFCSGSLSIGMSAQIDVQENLAQELADSRKES